MASRQNRQTTIVVMLLYLGYLLSSADRVIFGISMTPIKHALSLTDSQLGLLTGLAMGASYALFSPIGGLIVDRGKRKLLLAGAIGFWSVATFATGCAASFVGMGFARAGVGVGEAMLHPLAVSLMSDVVPFRDRPRAFGTYMSAGVVGSIGANILGGAVLLLLAREGFRHLSWLGALAPWQGLFMIAAVPGLLLAVAVQVVMREPERELVPAALRGEAHGAFAFVKTHPRFSIALLSGIAVAQMGAYTMAQWNVVFFERVHGWTASKAAILGAGTSGVATLAGCLFAGRLIGIVRARGHDDAPLIVAIVASLGFTMFATLALVMPRPQWALVFLPLASFWGYVPTICGYATMAQAVPGPIRARIAGLHTLANGLITNSLGPFLAGAFSDHLFPSAGGLRWALITTFFLATVLGGVLIAQGRAGYRHLLAQAQ